MLACAGGADTADPAAARTLLQGASPGNPRIARRRIVAYGRRMDLGLGNKVVFVTGASRGIGEALVHAFAKRLLRDRMAGYRWPDAT